MKNLNLIAWDTSAKTAAVGALVGNPEDGVARVMGEKTLDVQAVHSEKLLQGIDDLLESIGWDIRDIDLVGVGVGPGSFTGLRIGVSTANTIATAIAKPIVPFSSLEALGRPAQSRLTDELLVVVTEAAKGQIFARWGKASGEFIELPLVPKQLYEVLHDSGGLHNGWLAVGNGRQIYHEEVWDQLPSDLELVLEPPLPENIQGAVVALLAWDEYRAGKAVWGEVEPRYLRQSAAEEKLKAGLLKQSPTEPDPDSKPQ